MKILYITSTLAAFNAGDTIYSYGIVDRVADIADVDILTYSRENDPEFSYYHERLRKKAGKIHGVTMKKTDKILKYLRYRSTFVLYSSEMRRKLVYLLDHTKYDVVIIDHLRMAFVLDILKKYNVKIVLVQHNVETHNHTELLKLPGKEKYFLKNFGLPAFERYCMEEISNIWCITENDMKSFLSMNFAGEKNFEVVIPYFPYQRVKTDYTRKKKLVITGTMSWYPNVEGVEWFVKEVYHKLIEIDPEYKLYIVGRNPDDKIRALASDNIIVTGSVPSVDPYLVESDLLIVPNKLGGGAKIKVMEGSFKGIPAVILRPSVTGYEDFIPDSDFVVDNAEAYLESILRINDSLEKKQLFVEEFINRAEKATSLKNKLNSLI